MFTFFPRTLLRTYNEISVDIQGLSGGEGIPLVCSEAKGEKV